MTNANTVLTDSTSRSAAATTNFLSSLTTSLGAGGGLSGLFESLLAAAQTATQQQGATTTPAAASTAATTASNSNSDPSTANQAYASLSDIFAALHDFSAKWGIHHGSHKDDSGNANGNQKQCASSKSPSTATAAPAASTTSSPTSTTTSTADSTTPAATGSTAPTTNTCAATDSSGTTATTDSSVTTDPNAAAAPASFADLLAQLQSILQMLQKQIQTAQNTAVTTGVSAGTTTTDATGNTANTQGLQDLLAAGGALADLLALAQKLEKKLGMPSSDGTTQTAGTGTAIDPNLAALDTQIRTNLQTLVNNLQAAATANASAANAAAVTDTSTVSATDTSLLTASTTTTGSATPPTPTTPNEIIKSALATADDFLKQLNSLYASANTPSFASVAAVNAVAAANGNNGTGMDADQDDNLAAPTVSSSGASQAATPQVAADNVKPTNPYSFASQLSAVRAQNGGTAGLPSAVEQVLLLLNKNAKSGNDQMTLQLHPADLGSINVKLDFASDGTVSGTVVANNADTLAMLQKDSRSLERALQEAGLRADPGSLQFSLGGQSNNNSAGTQNQSGGATTSDTTASGLAALTPDNDFDTTDSWVITPNRVNIQV